ncbi:hypothetical protein Rsub_03622 [Raphidocelis subcapitata]|uniref:Uncharacterized protein n=1 Tax=Raphidocelis subcapitata TaxID=307507 RepID=A0A2V0NX98_9CHLO|nr:hypothetical protein Rsub_03622 [Raphidocelis subcapitata]|eukprot:GBF91302.1 hypothetical protein Rsub_03622 [Raphidocelis subcapitata]
MPEPENAHAPVAASAADAPLQAPPLPLQAPPLLQKQPPSPASEKAPQQQPKQPPQAQRRRQPQPQPAAQQQQEQPPARQPQQQQQQQQAQTKAEFKKSAANLDKARRVVSAPRCAALRSKALELIAKHAGAYAAEAGKTKWIVELVVRVLGESRDHIAAQDAQIAALRAEVEALEARGREAAAAAAGEEARLRQRVAELEGGLYNTGFTLHTAQREHFEMRQALEAAEGTARAATEECAQLAAAMRRAGEQDARVRRALAERACALKTALVDASSQLRGAHNADRREFREAEWRLRDRERALAAERAALEEQREAGLARDEALETLALQLHHAETELARLRQQEAEAAAAAAAAAVHKEPSPSPVRR